MNASAEPASGTRPSNLAPTARSGEQPGPRWLCRNDCSRCGNLAGPQGAPGTCERPPGATPSTEGFIASLLLVARGVQRGGRTPATYLVVPPREPDRARDTEATERQAPGQPRVPSPTTPDRTLGQSATPPPQAHQRSATRPGRSVRGIQQGVPGPPDARGVEGKDRTASHRGKGQRRPLVLVRPVESMSFASCGAGGALRRNAQRTPPFSPTDVPRRSGTRSSRRPSANRHPRHRLSSGVDVKHTRARPTLAPHEHVTGRDGRESTMAVPRCRRHAWTGRRPADRRRPGM